MLSVSIALMILALVLAIVAVFVPGRKIHSAAVVLLALGALLAHVPVTQ